MNGFWLGRRKWLWLADGVLVTAGIVLLLSAGNEVTRIVSAFVIVSRLVLAGVQVLVWKRQQSAGRDRVTRPR